LQLLSLGAEIYFPKVLTVFTFGCPNDNFLSFKNYITGLLLVAISKYIYYITKMYFCIFGTWSFVCRRIL